MTDGLGRPNSPNEPYPGQIPVAPHSDLSQPIQPAGEAAAQSHRQTGELKTAPCSRCGTPQYPWKMTALGSGLVCDACAGRGKREKRSRLMPLIGGLVGVLVLGGVLGFLVYQRNQALTSPQSCLRWASAARGSQHSTPEAKAKYADLPAIREHAKQAYAAYWGETPRTTSLDSFISVGLWATQWLDARDVQIEGDVAVLTYENYAIVGAVNGLPLKVRCVAYEHPEDGRIWKLVAIENAHELIAALPEYDPDVGAAY